MRNEIGNKLSVPVVSLFIVDGIASNQNFILITNKQLSSSYLMWKIKTNTKRYDTIFQFIFASYANTWKTAFNQSIPYMPKYTLAHSLKTLPPKWCKYQQLLNFEWIFELKITNNIKDRQFIRYKFWSEEHSIHTFEQTAFMKTSFKNQSITSREKNRAPRSCM